MDTFNFLKLYKKVLKYVASCFLGEFLDKNLKSSTLRLRPSAAPLDFARGLRLGICDSESSTYRSRCGFTLIEITITISLVVALATIFIGYSKSSRDQFAMINAHIKALDMFSRAKLLSTSGFLERGEQSKGKVAGQICGFGVHIDYDKNSAFIFRDVAENCETNANYAYDAGEELGGYLNEIDLDPKVLQFVEESELPLRDVVFIPPDPIVVINYDRNGNQKVVSASVEIKSVNPRFQNNIITISAAGQITSK